LESYNRHKEVSFNKMKSLYFDMPT